MDLDILVRLLPTFLLSPRHNFANFARHWAGPRQGDSSRRSTYPVSITKLLYKQTPRLLSSQLHLSSSPKEKPRQQTS